MRSRIRFYNRSGIPIEEITASTTREWLLNDFGECSFVFPKRSSKLIREVVEYGNRIFVTNPYTKPWAGVIDTPRTWTRKGLRVTAYSGEFAMGFYEDQAIDYTTNLIRTPVKLIGTAGSIYSQIINYANQMEDSLVRVGSIYGDGIDREQTLKGDFLTNIREVSKRAGNDFEIVPEEQSNNTLLFRANWYSRKGQTLDVTLEQGVNIQVKDEILLEQGVIRNTVMGVGAGSTDGSRVGAIRADRLSQMRFGMRQASASYATVKEVATLISNTEVFLRANRYPRSTAMVTCVDTNTFREINEGDVTKLILHDAGFLDDGSIGTNVMDRVLGMRAMDEAGTMDYLLDTFSEA